MTQVYNPPLPARLSQWSFTSPHEGVVPHLYVDTRGHVTCGVGFLIPDENALERYPWHPSVATARADYHELQTMPAGKLPIFYRRVTCARLLEADMRRIFDLKIAEFRRAIGVRWRLENQPECVQIALVDMAYTLGAAGLGKYANMYRAIMARDWSTAAHECDRRGVGDSRNHATGKLIASAGGADA